MLPEGASKSITKRNPIRDRMAIWREITWSPSKAALVTAYGLVCFAEFARDHWASAQLKAQLQFIPNLTWEGWTIGALALLLVATLEGSYRTIYAARHTTMADNVANRPGSRSK